jgi:hypothetical protein
MTYGCFDRAPFRPTVRVQQGWTADGRRKMEFIPFAMTTDCQYRHTELGQRDSGCDGCKWRDE